MPETMPEVIAATASGGYGKVVAKARVAPEGTLADIAIATSSGVAAIDEAVVRALGTWRLSSPVDKSGAKVSTLAQFPFTLGRFPKRVVGSEPAFPPEARTAFHNGKVVVSGRIDEEGRPIELKIVSSSKSELLDAAMLASVAAYRFEKPKSLDGQSMAIDASFGHSFSQAEEVGGSYITGLKSYSCRAFIGELDWWQGANPGAKASDREFYKFMGGLSFIAPDALGWGRGDLVALAKRHPAAWDRAVAACRAKPESSFLAEYKRG